MTRAKISVRFFFLSERHGDWINLTNGLVCDIGHFVMMRLALGTLTTDDERDDSDE